MRRFTRLITVVVLSVALGGPAMAQPQAPLPPDNAPLAEDRLVVFEAFMRDG